LGTKIELVNFREENNLITVEEEKEKEQESTAV